MATLIVAGNAVASDVASGKKFCAGSLYNATGTASGGGISARYIRDYQAGSTLDGNMVMSEVKAFDEDSVNIASGKTVTASLTAHPSYPLTNVTDNNTGSYFFATNNSSLQWLKVDLGAVYTIHAIQVLRLSTSDTRRTFHSTKLQVSANDTDWITVFDSVISGEYAEPVVGRIFILGS